ncbi:MAG: CocE/NonD family hydrolase [Gammaproteobacteria bacterium]
MNNRTLAGCLAGIVMLVTPALSQIHLVSDNVRRTALEEESRIERMVMVPMRDDVHLATRVYIPKGATGPVPTVFWRTPYNFSELNGTNPERPSAYLKFALDSIRHGYAFVIQNERGKYFSEGEWEILGFPRTDGYDALTWIADQEWSDGKVATLGCSSTAEWQPSLAAMSHPAHAAAVPMAYGAGIGRVGEFYEQGNFYRGGAIQQSMITWMFTEQSLQRPQLPSTMSRDDRIRMSRYTDLAMNIPTPDWDKALWHLPLSDMYEAYGGPTGAFDEMARRGPDDPGWYNGALYNDNEPYGVPSLWVSSWYDLSTAPNLEIIKHIRETAPTDIADSQYAIIAPTKHCAMYRLRDPLVVGERSMGDVDFEFDRLLWEFLNTYVKGEDNGYREQEPKVRYFAMSANEWRSADQWPPADSATLVLYLDSNEGANTLHGDGTLSETLPGAEHEFDQFRYDPLNPVPSLGGNLWASSAGSFDNRPIEARDDVLVFSTDLLEDDLDVTGKIEIILYVSSDAPDTDFTVKLLDVYPDGRAMNIDETIQRVRYRNGYDREDLMSDGEVYELRISPMTTSNVFLAGHRLRIEVSSSNFPRFQRNLNTGGDNYTESDTVIATNRVHHSKSHPSRLTLPVRR